MLSIETEARIVKLFLEIAKGENSIESTRRMMTNNYDFDPYQIFYFLDVEKKNIIDSIDIINYLTYKQFYINDIEAQLLILFYDQNFDGVLNYNEFKNLIISENTLNKKPSAKNGLGKISRDIDASLFNILQNEVRLVRNCLSLIEELKTRNDFNIHSIYHLLRGNNCIKEENIKDFLSKKDVIFSDGDLVSIMKRLDLNKDGKIDLNELHAFLGYPDCSVCCNSCPCPVCQMKDCNICFRDSPCFIHNRIHDDIFVRYNPNPENDKRPSYLTYSPDVNLKIDNDNSFKKNNLNNIDYSNKTSPLRDFRDNYSNNNYSPQRLNSNPNYDNNNFSASKRISKNLTLRASPDRKFGPKRIFSSDINNLNNSNNNIRNNNSENNEINDYINKKINEDEQQFLNYLKQAMISEKKIEEIKIKLSLNKDFNCEDAYRIFENDSKDVLTRNEIKYGLNLLNIYPSSKDLDLLFNKYCIKNKDTLEYGDFFDIVVPYEKKYRNMVEERTPNSSYVYRSPSIFSFNTGMDLKELFNTIIYEENKLNNIRREFSMSLKSNLDEFYRRINVNNNGKFDEQDMMSYVKKKGIFIDENACDLLFIRLDSNKNGTVELNEIEKEFKSVF